MISMVVFQLGKRYICTAAPNLLSRISDLVVIPLTVFV